MFNNELEKVAALLFYFCIFLSRMLSLKSLHRIFKSEALGLLLFMGNRNESLYGED
jgi:hypothetical protein